MSMPPSQPGRAEASTLAFRLTMIGAFAAIYVIWGSTYLAIRFAVETMPPLMMAAVRFWVAGGILYAFARARGAAAPTRAHWKSAWIIGGFLMLGGNGGVVWAESQGLSSGLAALLVATEPLWIVVLMWVSHERVRPTRGVVLGLLLGFGGVVVLVGGSGAAPVEASGLNVMGAVVVVLAACSWAQGSLLGRRLPAPSSPQLNAGTQMLAGGTLLFIAACVAGEPARFDPSTISLRSFAAFLYLIIMGAIVAFSAYSWLMRNAPPARVATYAFVNPAVAVLLGWALAGETLTPRTLIAAVVIVAAVVVITTESQMRARPRTGSTRAPREPLPTPPEGRKCFQ